MKKLILLLPLLIGCMSAAEAKKHNAESFKTPEIVGEIEGNKVYHYEIYVKHGDSYITQHVYYVSGKETVTSNNLQNKRNYVNVMINGIEYLPVNLNE